MPLPEYFDFAFATREPRESDLTPPDSLTLSRDVALATDLRVSSLTDVDRREIQKAAGFCHKNCPERSVPDLQYGLLRDRSSADREDTEGRLELALALSRLVSPSTLGLEVWGRASRGLDGGLRRIEMHYGPPAYKAQGERWWLLPDDWAEVGLLLSALDAPGRASWSNLESQFPQCVANAIRLFGKAAFQSDAQLRYLLVVPALEGMVLPDKAWQIKAKFKSRTSQICQTVGFAVDDAELEAIYLSRCDVAHVGRFRGDPQRHLPHYLKLEQMMRAILKKAILDSAFRAAFRDEASLQTAWPV